MVGGSIGDSSSVAALALIVLQPITLKGIAIYRAERGKLMERWVVSDLYGALAESGALSAR
jgi:hypothetical protein